LDFKVHSNRGGHVSTSTPAPTLREQLDGITTAIPEPIGTRIDAGVAEIEASRGAPGLAVGDPAPAFTLPDALGRPLSVADLLADGPVVAVFYRGDWCPYCNLQLHALQDALPTIRELGASLVAISPQAADHSLSLTEKHELAFPVLSDLDQHAIRAYQVQFTLAGDLEDLQVNVFQNDPAVQNADHSRSLPVPAVFVIDQDSIVRAAFVSADWRVRAEPADIIAALHAPPPHPEAR
jgi:peroxiredoxin